MPATLDTAADLRPEVASARRNTGAWAIGAGSAALGVLAFAVLSARRPVPPRQQPSVIASAVRAPTTGVAAPAAAIPDFSALDAAGRGRAPATPGLAAPILPPQPAPAPVPMLATPAPPPVAVGVAPPRPVTSANLDVAQRLRAPTLVVDLAEPPSPALAAGAAAAVPGASAGAGGGQPGRGGANAPSALNGDEQFAARVETAAEPERVRATMLRNPSATVVQGTVIPGVLETALNSDLPGFARAVVSRDVRSFDGSTVLIPRGSHVIGQYRSGVALGASRAFVIWSRVLRPDGASVQIGSSGTDQLGRAGLEGQVDRHFFQRFGGSILLSVLSAGVGSLARTPSTQVVIGSSAEANNVASSALSPSNISPTIKVAQGTPIRIFVARDLDFSSVQRAQP